MIRAAAVCVLIIVTLGSMSLGASPGYFKYGSQGQYGSQSQGQSKDKSQPNAPSDAEQKAMDKIQAAPDVAAKLVAAGEFIKKYPKSTMRSKVVSYVTQEIGKEADPKTRATQLESTLTVFKEPSDAEMINPVLVDAYFKAKLPDDAFRVATAYLAKNPNDLAVLSQASIEGIREAKNKNPKFVEQSHQYGTKAIELIESGKKPVTFDDARWNEYKTAWLPTLYRSLAMLSYMTGNKQDARAKIDKALALDSGDAFSYALIGYMLNDEYQQLAEQHKGLSAGPLKDSVLKQALAKMDDVVDMLAHAVALSEGSDENKGLHDQSLQDLQAYYKYRHGGSAEGLQQLIDKYKKQQ